jgi:hypothetical protein
MLEGVQGKAYLPSKTCYLRKARWKNIIDERTRKKM